MNRQTSHCEYADRADGPATAAEVVRLGDEVRRLQEEIRTLGRLNRLQERFVAVASHEFKTPLTSITAYAEALLTGAAEDPARRTEFLGVVRDEAARLLRMVNRILDFSRLEYGSRLLDRAPVDLVGLAQETSRSFGAAAAARGQTVQVEAAGWVPSAEADADLVRQALVNLLGNALKFAPDGGIVTVTVRETAGTVAVDVADNGPGIPAADLQRIFSAFYRTDEAAGVDGTGLGLSIVNHIVNLHGGCVTVANGPDRGAVFTVALPQTVETVLTGAAGDRSIVANLLRLLAEFTGAATAVLLQNGPDGRGRPVHWLGFRPSRSAALRESTGCALPRGTRAVEAARDLGLDAHGPRDRNRWLSLELGPDGEHGAVLLGRAAAAAAFEVVERRQVPVLARLAERSLAGADRLPEPTLEALRVLAQAHRQGVPAATPAAVALAADLGERLGMGRADLAALQDAVLLHDAGMARVEEEIVLARGDLSPDEQEEIDRHVELGLDLLAPLLVEPRVAAMIRHHHERWDGQGHPDGLAGQDIPLGARVLAVVDAWFALTRGRSYRPGRDAASALTEIRRCGGTQFDPDVVTGITDLVDGLAETVPGAPPADPATVS
ncbi:MAG: HD domain-containing protein [bacterium]|nr:HD domain-containing protein [bacterium]